MTLEEYEKVLEEKRKALMALKPEERKVDLDKEFESMQLISNKKNDDSVFIKLVRLFLFNSVCVFVLCYFCVLLCISVVRFKRCAVIVFGLNR